MTPQRLGMVIRTLRERKDLTQDALARRAKITKPYLSQLETGIRKNPSLPVLQRIAKVLGVSHQQLLGGVMKDRWEGEVHYIDYEPNTARRSSGLDALVVGEAWIHHEASGGKIGVVIMISAQDLKKKSALQESIDAARGLLPRLVARHKVEAPETKAGAHLYTWKGAYVARL